MRDSPTECFDYLIVKRLFDLVFASCLLIILMPFLLLIGLAVKVSSTGPIIFRQQRVGLNGRRFWIYKFRTMETISRHVSDTQWTATQECQVTTVGRYLRRASLDELPQLINVLKGDMSMVGPRPERPYFVEIFKREIPEYMTRHSIKCGMTGWAQINGWRGNTSIGKRIQHDLYYMQHWTLWFDLRILLFTLRGGILQPETSRPVFPQAKRSPTQKERFSPENHAKSTGGRA
jgi:exopolysaccharide biosynthesis polyprenyl glycosylphosphotransferase